FLSPFGGVYAEQIAGPAAAGALYLLLALGLASFAVNAGGWRWRRALAWAAFAWLGTSYWRLVPYFALVGGPAVVLNVQEFLARKRAAARERESAAPPPVGAPALSRSRALAVLARAGLLLALLILLALAWPGW